MKQQAERKKAHSCFIHTQQVELFLEPEGVAEKLPRLRSQLVSSDYPCVNPMKQGVRCRGAASLAQPPKCLPRFLSTLGAGNMTSHIPRLSPEPGLSCCATSGSLTQHGDDDNQSHLFLGKKDETTSAERSKGLSSVGQAFLSAVRSDETEVVLMKGQILVDIKPLGKDLLI